MFDQWLRRFLIGAALPVAISMLLAAPARAGFLAPFEGYSVFGLDDAGTTTNVCALCDSTVNFAVWQNTDGNWLDDLPTPTDLVGTSTGQEKFVLLYQVINTNPLGGSNPSLQDFNISFGPPGTVVPFQTGGFLDGTVFENATNAVSPLDTPNDKTPSSVSAVTPFATNSQAIDPSSLAFNLIANIGVNAGAAFEGAQFIWDSATLIGADLTSSVLFLTGDRRPSYHWAETQSAGGFGAPGDVPSIPEPGTLLLLGSGLLGLALSGRDHAKL